MSGALKVRKFKHHKVEAHTYGSTAFSSNDGSWCLDPIIYHANMNITLYLFICVLKYIYISSQLHSSLHQKSDMKFLNLKSYTYSLSRRFLHVYIYYWTQDLTRGLCWLIAGCSGNGYSCGKAGPVHCTRWSAPFCCEFPTTSEDI